MSLIGPKTREFESRKLVALVAVALHVAGIVRMDYHAREWHLWKLLTIYALSYNLLLSGGRRRLSNMQK